MTTELLRLHEEWCDLRKKTAMVLQDYIPGKKLKISSINHVELTRRKAVAKILCKNIDELDLKPGERYELRQDCL